MDNHLLPIVADIPEDIIEFYNHFTDYQYHYMNYDFDIVISSCKILRGIYITSPKLISFNQNLPCGEYITEIIAPNVIINYDTLITYYPSIEKLEVHMINNLQYLPRLKYLQINGHVANTKEMIENLPDTIESLIIADGADMSTIHDYQFPHLSYLKINLPCHTFSTSLNINTIVFLIHCDPDRSVEINIPNVKNIIIAQKEIKYITTQVSLRKDDLEGTNSFATIKEERKGQIQQLKLTALNANTCHIVNIDVIDKKFSLGCQVINRDTRSSFTLDEFYQYYETVYYETVIDYDPNISFIRKRMRDLPVSAIPAPSLLNLVLSCFNTVGYFSNIWSYIMKIKRMIG
jgi:hypothetical protein